MITKEKLKLFCPVDYAKLELMAEELESSMPDNVRVSWDLDDKEVRYTLHYPYELVSKVKSIKERLLK